jgi:hypothetical protein
MLWSFAMLSGQSFVHANHNALRLGIIFRALETVRQPGNLIVGKSIRSIIEGDEVDAALNPVIVRFGLPALYLANLGNLQRLLQG